MSDNAYRLIGLLIQGIGAIAIVFYFGKYVGKSDEMFKSLFKGLASLQQAHDTHVDEDEDRHTAIIKDIADVRVTVAERTVRTRRGD